MSLQRASRELLQRLEPNGRGEVRRATFEVVVDGRTELVTATLQPDGALLVAATDGDTAGPHVQAALRLLAGLAADAPEEAQSPRDSIPPAGEPQRSPIGDALDELLLAITRHGVDGAASAASVDEAIDRLVGLAGKPAPRGLERFVGRLRTAVSRRDAASIARVLDGASRFAAMLREPTLDAEGRRCRAAWLGRPGERESVETAYDRVLVEVGREWFAGLTRGSLQRRYLVCTTTGEVFREERARGSSASVGSCPRLVVAGLAELTPGPLPRVIQLLQYAVTPSVPQQAWEKLRDLAVPSIEELRPRYRAAVKAFPALAEPFTLVAARGFEGGRFVDGAGDVLPVRSAVGGVEARIATVAARGALLWVAGRLDDDEGVLVIDPVSIGTELDGVLRCERLR